jgi:magnesium chelatase family protein
VSPAQPPGSHAGLDLAIAVAVLTAAGVVPAGAADGCVLAAGLGLDGRLRPVRGILPALLAARAGCTRAVVAPENSAEAAMVPGLAVAPCSSLQAVAAWLRREPFPADPATLTPGDPPPEPAARPPLSLAQAGVSSASATRLALETSAAGGHHLCLTGRRDARILDLAAGLAALLPPLTPAEVLEVSVIHSAAGLLGPGHALVTRPPFRAPAHAATAAAMAGGGPDLARPGEAALAHRGVMCLASAADFARDTLAVLRQPLADGQITISRAGRTVRLPARFILIAGLAPCPCPTAAECTCTQVQAHRYRARLTRELGRYIPLWHTIPPAGPPGPAAGEPPDPDARSADRVALARDRAARRLRDTAWQVNADIPGPELRRAWQPPAEALAPITRAASLGEISTRAADQVIRVAWTLADLAGSDRPDARDCGQALAFHLGVAR